MKDQKRTKLWLILIFFADYKQLPKREYLNDDGESSCTRAFYRSYTRLHRYVHLVKSSILKEHFQQSFFKKAWVEWLGWTLDIWESCGDKLRIV